MEESRHKEHIV